MKFNRIWTSGVYVLAALLCLAAPALAQISSSTGAIQGTVTDPAGAVVVGAKVTAINTATGTRSEVTTQSDGGYVFALLSPGMYRVEVESEGFRRSVLQGVAVEVTKVVVANAHLELGAVTSEVVVSDSVQNVDTTTATTGDVIGGDLIRAIPLPTRNFLDLTALQAGVAATMSNPAALGRGAPQLFVAGQRGTVNNFVLNGVDANNFGSNNFAQVPVPNPDAVQEFRVSTSQYDASQGRGSGGNINVLVRSGASDFHGNAFWFYRSDALNANDFFFNRNGAPKPVLLQNQLGGTIGGPVPGLKETFWFFSYQATRQKNGVAGAVSGLQPVIGARDAASLAADFGIPLASVDPVALAWVNRPGPYGGLLYPSGVGAAVGQTGSYSASAPSFFNENQYTASFDREMFHNNRLGARFFYSTAAQTNPLGGGVTLGQGQDNPQANYNVAVSDTHVFSSSLLNEFRAGFTLLKNKTQAFEGTTIGDIGMSRFNSSFFDGTPAVFFNDGTLSWGGISTNNDQASQNLSGTVSDTVSWTRGKHTVRGGIEWRRYHVNTFNNFASRGFLVFANFADFLQGAPDDIFAGTGITDRGFRAYDVSWFAQDDYRIFRRLTLNLGLRHDFLAPSTDIRDRLGNYDPSLLTAGCLQTAGNCLAAGFVSPSGLSGFGTPGVSHSTLLGNDWNNFGPRIGLAYDVFGDGKLAVRSGYGVYFIRTSNQTLLQLITAAPFFQLFRTTGTNIAGSGILANPYPALPTPDQFPRLPIFPQFNGLAASGAPIFVDPATSLATPLLTINPFERTLRTPYNQNWNLTVQYEFLKDWTLEAGYLGSRGNKLLASRQRNQALLRNANNPGLGGLTTNSVADASARVSVPGFSSTGLNTVTGTGDSYYHALIFSVRHKFGHGFDVKGDYTFSKSLDTNSGAAAQDLGNAGGNQLVDSLAKGLSLFDQKHRLVFTYLWDIPGPKSGWLGQVAGGWTVSGVSIFQSGFPLTVTANTTGATLAGFGGSGLAFANATCQGGFAVAGDANLSVNAYLNRNCFAGPTDLLTGAVTTVTVNNLTPFMTPGTQSYTITGTATSTETLFGGGMRGLARGPFQQRFDFAVAKKFRLTPLYALLGEQTNLEFRSEFFKLFNTPIFGNQASINTNINSGTFGRISSTVDTTGRVIQFALKLNF